MYRFKILTALSLTLVWNDCVQAAQIAHWRLDEGIGSTTTNAFGTYNGTLINSPQWTGGISTNALGFNGTNQYVRVNTGPILGNAANYTIEAWVKWDGGGTPGAQLIYCEGSFNDIIDVYLSTGVPSFTVLAGSWHTTSASAALPTNEWHHIAAVLKSGVGGILYVDGQAVSTNASMGPASQGTAETDIGRFAGGGGSRYFRGTIDEVQVFNNARTQAEILAEYQQFTTANLTVIKTASPDPVFVGSNLTYTIEITNSGPANAASVVLTDALPASVSFVSATSSQGACTNEGGIVTGSLGTLANGTAAIVSVTVTVNSSGQITNTCTVNTTSSDPNAADDTATVVVTANIAAPSIVSQPSNQSVSAGGTATFTVQAAGSPPFTYQWQLNGTNIDGATGFTLVITNITVGQAGIYTVIVSNAVDSVTSSNAVLTVLDLQLYAVVTLGGPVGSTYSIQYVNDIADTNWTTLTNITLTSSPYFHIDFGSPGAVRRFYRAVLAP